MMPEELPWFVFAALFVPGVALIATGVPLVRRRIPPNMFYGVRLTATLGDEVVWYEINARGGRDFIWIGVGNTVVAAASVIVGDSWSIPFRIFLPLGLLAIALVLDTIVLARAASRLAASRALT
jgi:uncharacterized membrane protein